MANRREFLQVSVAASALVSLIPAFPAVATPDPVTSLSFYKVLCDSRFPDSLGFAQKHAEQGVPVHAMAKGDITPFWRNELAAIWAVVPVPVVGMTTEGPLFCLEQLGRQYGLRVVQRETQASGLIAWVLAPNRTINKRT